MWIVMLDGAIDMFHNGPLGSRKIIKTRVLAIKWISFSMWMDGASSAVGLIILG